MEQEQSNDLALVSLQNDLLREGNRQRESLLVLLDLFAAFDSILQERLLSTGIESYILRWFQSFLDGRSQMIQLRDAMFTPWDLSHGVP